MRGFIPKGRSIPASLYARPAEFLPRNDGICFHHTPALFSYRFEGCSQGRACHAMPSILLVRHKAGNPPKPSGCAFKLQRPVTATAVDSGQLYLQPVLAPAHRLAIRVDQDPVCLSLLNELFLFPAVARSSLQPGRPPLVLRQSAWPLKMHAPAKIPPISLREQFLKIRPGAYPQFLSCVCVTLRTHEVSLANRVNVDRG